MLMKQRMPGHMPICLYMNCLQLWATLSHVATSQTAPPSLLPLRMKQRPAQCLGRQADGSPAYQVCGPSLDLLNKSQFNWPTGALDPMYKSTDHGD